MSASRSGLPDASDIGLLISGFRCETPQWQIYEGTSSGEKMVAWRLLPAHLRLSGSAGGLSPLIPVWAGQRDRALDKSSLVAPVSAYSQESDSGWLVYPGELRRVDWPMRDRAALVNLVNALTEALNQLHVRGGLHLDVHPSHICEQGGNFYLLGLGVDIRKAAGDATGSNAGLARRYYGPPEMWDASGRSALGPWTDIFSAAATLYFLVCGKAPPDFRDRIGKPHWRTQLANELNEALAHSGVAWPKMVIFILAGLELSPTDRPATVAAWAKIWDEVTG